MRSHRLRSVNSIYDPTSARISEPNFQLPRLAIVDESGMARALTSAAPSRARSVAYAIVGCRRTATEIRFVYKIVDNHAIEDLSLIHI